VIITGRLKKVFVIIKRPLCAKSGHSIKDI
jgi:hypothetical protein